MQSTDEGLVGAAVVIGEFPEAEINAAVVADADEGALARGGAVAAAPHPRTELQITEGNGDLLPAVINVALVHRPGDVGQGGDVFVRVLLPVPALQQPEAHLAGIEIEGIDLVIGDVMKRLIVGREARQHEVALLVALRHPLRGIRSQGDQAGEHQRWQGQRQQQPAVPPPGSGGLVLAGNAWLHAAGRRPWFLGSGSNQGTMTPSATSHVR